MTFTLADHRTHSSSRSLVVTLAPHSGRHSAWSPRSSLFWLMVTLAHRHTAWPSCWPSGTLTCRHARCSLLLLVVILVDRHSHHHARWPSRSLIATLVVTLVVTQAIWSSPLPPRCHSGHHADRHSGHHADRHSGSPSPSLICTLDCPCSCSSTHSLAVTFAPRH